MSASTPFPGQSPVGYPETGYPGPREPYFGRREFRYALVGVALLVTGFVGGLFYAHVRANDSRTAPTPEATVNLCANSAGAARERDKLTQPDPAAAGSTPVQVSDGTGTWCVLGQPGNAGRYWGIVYVGQDNPVYLALTADSGDDPDKPRASLTFPGSPPVTMARDGWIGFATPSGGEPWTEFRTGAATILLFDLATGRR